MSSTTSAPATPSSITLVGALNGSSGKAAQAQGQSVNTFFASLGFGAVAFGIQIGIFLFLKTRLSRV